MADNLERARIAALSRLAALPQTAELQLGEPEPTLAYADFLIGLGLLIGKGHAAYRGFNHYRLTDAGRAAAAELAAD